MSDKYVAPPDMVASVRKTLCDKWDSGDLNLTDSNAGRYQRHALVAASAAVKWIAENPIIPTHKQIQDIADSNIYYTYLVAQGIVEWQRRMFLAPVPPVPEEIKDLMVDTSIGTDSSRIDATILNERVIDAYNRGRKLKG